MEKEEVKIPVKEHQNTTVNLNNVCCDSSTSCGGNSISPEESEIHDKESSKTELRDENKLYIDVFVPLNACECVWSQFMNLVFSALAPYMKHIKFETKNLDSEEARKLNLNGNCVIVDGKKKFITSFALKKELPKLLKEKALI
ncbi:MAG: hypothetical protein ACFE8G_13730 [Candidatus Hermodarchaeota archaeon]